MPLGSCPPKPPSSQTIAGRCVHTHLLAPSEWPQDVHQRSQDTIPTIFGCKRAVFEKCLLSSGQTSIFDWRWAKLRSEHPLFCGLKPPPRAIWTRVTKRYPWATRSGTIGVSFCPKLNLWDSSGPRRFGVGRCVHTLPLAPSEWPQDSTRGLKARPQPSLDAKRRFSKIACCQKKNMLC